MITVLDAVAEKLNASIEALEQTLSRCGCKSYDEYRHVCGQIQGLRTALSIQEDLLRVQEENDE
jgi:hypothetical protein